MAIFNSKLLVYQRVNLHFPMVFPWFSHGFPMVFYTMLHLTHGLARCATRRSPRGPLLEVVLEAVALRDRGWESCFRPRE